MPPRRNTREPATAPGTGRNIDEDEDDDDDESAAAAAAGELSGTVPGVDVDVDVDVDANDDGGDVDDDYGHAERAFLQAFLARSVMSGDEVRGVLGRIWGVKGRGGAR